MLGVLVMLLGALMVIVPSAGAGAPGNNGTVKIDGQGLTDGPGHTGKPNDPDETDPDNDPHVGCEFQLEFFGYDPGQMADIVFTAHPSTGDGGVLFSQSHVVINPNGVVGGGSVADWTINFSVLEDFDTSQFTSVHEVHGWHVKLSLTLYNADGSPVPGGQKHKLFWVEECAPTPEFGSLSVDKVVTGNDQLASTTQFPFTVDCAVGEQAVDLNGEAAGTQATFALTAPQTPWVRSGIPVGATCTVIETNAHGADSTTSTVDGGSPVASLTRSGVAIGAGTRAVVFTNTFTPYIPPYIPPPTPVPASLTVEKDVTGDVPDEWEFTFRLRGGATNELFTLDEADDDEAFTVPAGTYVLTEFEVPNDGATLVDVECLDGNDATGDVDEGVVTLELAAGHDVTCTFTNDFAEVAPSVVTTTTTTTTTVAPATTTTTAAPAAVLGESITRLPRTGTHTGELAAVGVLLIGLGASMVFVARRRGAVQL